MLKPIYTNVVSFGRFAAYEHLAAMLFDIGIMRCTEPKRDCPFVGNLSGLIFALPVDGRAYIALAVGFSDYACCDVYYRQADCTAS